MKIAAIDIGSNSIKLLVVDAAASDSFAVLAREKDMVRLGHETLRVGKLSPAAIERAVECIKRFRSIAEARGAERIFAVATASVREAANSAQFVKEVQRKTGVTVEILSPIEEGRLIGLAAAHACSVSGKSILNIDIGGGSTELSLMPDGAPETLLSVRLGAVGLTEQFLTSDPPKSKELRALREEIRSALERPARELKNQHWPSSTGTSGTILAIGTALRLRALNENEQEPTGARPAGDEIELAKLIAFNSRVADLNSSERRLIPGISSQRSEIIVAGGQILEGVMQALAIDTMRTCSWALREGVLIDRLREIEIESNPPRPDVDDYRLLGVHAVGRRFEYEEPHAHQVTRLAERIFDYLSRSNLPTKFDRHQRTMLSAAALLHDVGYHIAHDSHHKHSLYLIKHSELTGFSEAERDVIANAARYHRGSEPKDRHENYAALNEADRETVNSLAAILRIADALDRRHDSRVSDLRCVRNGRVIHIELVSSMTCDREIIAAEQKRDFFEKVFNCRLEFSRRAALKRA
jgi:exopolyphosphatase / guanosine-5'-triphosphate,3'-diphosphate pyrophosphatase